MGAVLTPSRRRHRRVGRLSALVGTLLIVAAPSAWGFGHTPPGGGGDTGGGTPPPVTQTGGSSGGNQQKNTGGCRVYATPSNIGLSCITGGSGDVTTVKELLDGDPAPSCWDDVISDADLARIYGYEKVTGVAYYLHSCIIGLALNHSLYNQPDLNLTQWVIEIPDGAPRCPRPFTVDQVGTCVQWLTVKQTKVAESLQAADSDIPGIVLVTRPSEKVHTNVPTAFVDSTRVTDVPARQIGAVRVWAQLDDQYIEPNGPGVAPRKQCRLTDDVGVDDTPETKPDACWWTYPQSSAGQPDHAYPFRASVHWTVYYADRAGTHVLAQFVKYAQLQLRVFDIQTLVTS